MLCDRCQEALMYNEFPEVHPSFRSVAGSLFTPLMWHIFEVFLVHRGEAVTNEALVEGWDTPLSDKSIRTYMWMLNRSLKGTRFRIVSVGSSRRTLIVSNHTPKETAA